MTVLVTGAAGFIGYHTSKALLKKEFNVIGIDNINDYYNVTLKFDRLIELGIEKQDAQNFNQLFASNTYPSFQFSRMDITHADNINKLCDIFDFDAVIHLAAQAGVRYSLENPSAYIDSNIVGFKNVLEVCRNLNVKHLVYASSSSVYGANSKIPFSEDDNVDYPVSLYAATKKSNELMAHTYSHLYNIPTTGLRFFTVYGPWGRPDMAPMLFANAMLNDKEIKVFNHGNMSRDFTYIDDIVKGIEIALANPKIDEPPYQIFNIGNGAPVQLLDFIQFMEHALDSKAKKHFMDMQPGDVPKTWANTSKLEKLGYASTTTIEDGTKLFADWYKTYTSKSN